MVNLQDLEVFRANLKKQTFANDREALRKELAQGDTVLTGAVLIKNAVSHGMTNPNTYSASTISRRIKAIELVGVNASSELEKRLNDTYRRVADCVFRTLKAHIPRGMVELNGATYFVFRPRMGQTTLFSSEGGLRPIHEAEDIHTPGLYPFGDAAYVALSTLVKLDTPLHKAEDWQLAAFDAVSDLGQKAHKFAGDMISVFDEVPSEPSSQ